MMADNILEVEIERAIRRAVAEGYEGAGRMISAFAAGMEVGAKGDMTRVNRLIAEDARTAIGEAYGTKVEAVRATPAYPRYGRRSGYLGAVVRRPDLVSGDHTGIRFISESTISKEAAHWRRLNFGAGRAAGAQPSPYPLRLFGQTLGTLQFSYGPSPAFALPKGFFLSVGGSPQNPQTSYRGSGSSAAFYPNRKSPYTPAMTEGIRGRHFLEEGLEVLSVQLEVRYADLLNEWVQKGGRKANAISKAVG